VLACAAARRAVTIAPAHLAHALVARGRVRVKVRVRVRVRVKVRVRVRV